MAVKSITEKEIAEEIEREKSKKEKERMLIRKDIIKILSKGSALEAVRKAYDNGLLEVIPEKYLRQCFEDIGVNEGMSDDLLSMGLYLCMGDWIDIGKDEKLKEKKRKMEEIKKRRSDWKEALDSNASPCDKGF